MTQPYMVLIVTLHNCKIVKVYKKIYVKILVSLRLIHNHNISVRVKLFNISL